MAERYRIERVRLYPTPAQCRQLESYAGAHRWTWNWALATRQAHFAEHASTLSYYEQGRALTVLQQHPDMLWLTGVPRRVKVGALRDLDKAYRAAFRRVQRGERAGFPRFKARKRGDASFEIPAETRFDGRRVKVPGIGWVRARGGRGIVTSTTSGRFFRDRAGDWWAALRYVVAVPDTFVPDSAAVGVHLQPEHAMTLSTGEVIARSAFVGRANRKLRRLKRAAGRTRLGSGNRRRAQRRLARGVRHLANQRKDWQHKVSRSIVDTHPLLVMQERETRALPTGPENQRAVWGGRTRASRISDATWGGLIRLIQEKAAAAGCPVVTIPAEVPTTAMCCTCEHERAPLSELVSIWLCEHCGTLHERGTNAARNILSMGMRTDRRREAPGDEKRLLTRLKTPVGAGGARLTSVSKKQ
ncbi:MAG: transposase [Chloroflexota bacterium]|nr:transposase [Chloroflexota bacterium]